jgi:hypothetical protein
VSSLFFLPVYFFRLSQAASVAVLPSALFVERFSLGASWASSIQQVPRTPQPPNCVVFVVEDSKACTAPLGSQVTTLLPKQGFGIISV